MAWLRSATVDLQVAMAVTRERVGAPWAACFHAQQAIEKTLKASMVWAGIPIPDTHDLRALAHDLPTGWPGSSWAAQITALTVHAVDTRYPLADYTPSWEDADQAVQLAERCARSVLGGLYRQGLPRTPQPAGQEPTPPPTETRER